jgi:hypothetical protein
MGLGLPGGFLARLCVSLAAREKLGVETRLSWSVLYRPSVLESYFNTLARNAR